MLLRRNWIPLLGAFLVVLFATSPNTSLAQDENVSAHAVTSTPIKHLVVMFQENVSFDHYFGTGVAPI